MADRLAHLTEAQRRAIRLHDRSILVSAAAGSGKTTVLAERCAALVCDGEPKQRCGIDELLVVTFTDAAAGEMKSRIAAAIRQRLESETRDRRYLQQQLYLLDSASISTIHSFCRTLIGRYFPQAEVDPQASVLNADEAELLRGEVLDALCLELYGDAGDEGRAFQSLVDDYGAGSDNAIKRIVLQIHDFINSLPRPYEWLDDAVRRVDPASPESLAAKLDAVQCGRLCDELALQIEYAEHCAATIRACWPVAGMHAEAIDEHAARLADWRATVGEWEPVAAAIRDFEFERARSRPKNLSDEDKAAFDSAKALRDRTKELFATRLQTGCCAFTKAEYVDGLARIAPHVSALCGLVREFDERYRAAKTDAAAVDFNDLQRCAFKLLAEGGDPLRPSDVARQLQRQYRHILVDEFQDIDPLQEAILKLASREYADPPQGNLFTVGDIKQSIYRFRLAEPGLFTARADQFAGSSSEKVGELIHLKENFRSRSAIIDAINLVFHPLMRREFGGSDYDESAALVAAASFPEAPADEAASPTPAKIFNRPAVELHVLEPITEATRSEAADDGEQGEAAGGGDDDLEGIEREAYLIARRIQQWTGVSATTSNGANRSAGCWHVAARPSTPGGPPTTRPIEYRDIVILLRSTVHKAGPMADVLRRMGIPVRIERDDTGMDCTEFRDVLSLLSVLDNLQQDLPLAAVMRSPLLVQPFTEGELVEIRLFAPGAPFHRAVTRYAAGGADEALRSRVQLLLASIDRYRTRIQREPVADVLWELLRANNYLAYVAGLPDGARRRGNLLRIHELAREFGRFARQGLHRFLRFIEELIASERTPQQPAGPAADENAVRIMTVHASKGLEFPVVILADLQKTFNLTDVRSTVVIDREYGVALRAADPQRRTMYPTLVHQLAAEASRHESLAEELRVLYVALTRAREHLLLVGRDSLDRLAACATLHASSAAAARPSVPRLQLETASNYLHWLLPALTVCPREHVRWPGEKGTAEPLFKVYAYPRATSDAWRIPPAVQPDRVEALTQLAKLQPLTEDEPLAPAAQVEPLLAPLHRAYGSLELTTVPARISVSELKRRWQAEYGGEDRVAHAAAGDEGRASTHRDRPGPLARPVFLADDAAPDPIARGLATHRFLQLVDLKAAGDTAGLQAQLDEMVASGRMSKPDADAVLLDSAAWLFATDLGVQLRAASAVYREVPFVSRIAPERFDPLLTGRDHRDVLLIRGVVDVVLPTSEGLEIIDYKTDAISADECAQRAESYRPQVDTYASVMAGIFRQKVIRRSLAFLQPRRLVELTDR
jgi:ATP-dependent helicase/nuclease subunit A